jgi:hypothetical protein
MKKFREVADSDGDAVAAADPSSLRNRRCIPIDLAASLVNLNLDPKAIIKIEDLPPGSLLTCGQGNSNNTWSLKLAETEDVVFIAPIDDNSDSFPISVRILMPDPDGFDYASTIHKFDILLTDTSSQSAFTAIQADDGKGEPAQLGALKDALAKARGLGDIKLNKKNALNFDEESAAAFEGQRSSASLQALFSAEQKEEEERRRIKDAEEEWRAHEERRLAEARAEWMLETEAKVVQAVAETRMQEEQRLLAAEARFREQLTEKLEDAKARWKAKSASRGTGAGTGRAAPADIEATVRIRMTAEETRLQQEAAQKIADAEVKFRAQLVEKLGAARKEWQADEAARQTAALAAFQAEEANRLGQAKLKWLGEIEAKTEDSKPATDEIEAVVKERLASSQAKWQRDALEGLAQAEAKWKEAETARIESARREWQSDTERRLQEAVAGVPQVDVEQVVRERIASMQTRWQTEALNAISDAEGRWKKAEKEKLDAARKEWVEEKDRLLKDMASAVPAVDLEGIVIERMRAAQAKWQEEAVGALVDAENRWKAAEAERIKTMRAELQKEFDSRIKDPGSLDVDLIVQKKMAASQQKWQEEFLKVIADSEKKWKAGEAERLKEAKAQWEKDFAGKAGSGSSSSGGASAADIEKQVKERVETELAVMEAVWRSEEAQRLKAAEKEFGKQYEKKFSELELQHIEDLQKLHSAEAKLVELQAATPKDAKVQRAVEQERLAAAEKEWAASAEKRLKSAEEDWKAGEAQRLQAAEAAWKAGEQKRLDDLRAELTAAEDKRRLETASSGGPASAEQLKAAEAAWKAAEELRFKEAQATWKAAEERHRHDAEAAWRSAEQKRLDEAHVTWQSQTERRFALIEKQVKDYQTQQAAIIERQVAEKLAAAEAAWKTAEAERLRAAQAEWAAITPGSGASPEQIAEQQRVAVAEAEQKLREQMLAMEEKTRIRVADELVEAQRFWQEAADLKLAAERAQWQADAERRIAEAQAKVDPAAQAQMVAEIESRLKAEHAQEMDGMRASIDAMMAANAQRLEKEHSQRIAVMESQWRNSTAHTANEARAAASTESEQRIAELTRERDEAIARLAQQPAALDSAMSADRVTLEIRIAQLETERDAAVRRAEDSQRNLALREEAQSRLTSQSDSQLAAAVAAERMKWQAEAEQRVAAERREKEQAVELLKLAEARLRAMPTVDPALEAKWKADMEMRVAQTRAMFTAEAAAAMQAAETKWKSETDQRFAIAEEMFKEIYEEQLSAAEAKWRADENQRFAAAREAWMVDARTKGLGGGGDSSLATSIEAALNAKFELKVADLEARFLAQREAAIAEARRQWESSEIDRLIDAQSEFQVNADRRVKELEIRLKAQFAGQIAEAERLWKDGEAKRLAAARAKWKAESDDRVADAETRMRNEYERLLAQGAELRTGSGG